MGCRVGVPRQTGICSPSVTGSGCARRNTDQLKIAVMRLAPHVGCATSGEITAREHLTFLHIRECEEPGRPSPAFAVRLLGRLRMPCSRKQRKLRKLRNRG